MNNTQHNTRTRRDNRGSILILTIVIATVLFSIGISIASILEKEVKRHRYADQSIIALNVANTAFECTLYNDFRSDVFNSGRDIAGSVDCGRIYQVRSGSDWEEPYEADPVSGTNTASGTGRYEFTVIQLDKTRVVTIGTTPDLDDGIERPCANVVVRKQCLMTLPSGATVCPNGLIESYIEVKGYFSCMEGNESSRDLIRRFRVYY